MCVSGCRIPQAHNLGRGPGTPPLELAARYLRWQVPSLFICQLAGVCGLCHRPVCPFVCREGRELRRPGTAAHLAKQVEVHLLQLAGLLLRDAHGNLRRRHCQGRRTSQVETPEASAMGRGDGTCMHARTHTHARTRASRTTRARREHAPAHGAGRASVPRSPTSAASCSG